MADERRPPGPRPPSATPRLAPRPASSAPPPRPTPPSLRDRLASLPRVLPRASAGPRGGAPSSRPSTQSLPWSKLLLWPVGASAAITLLRLVGERRGWSADYFSRLPGGGLAPIGITWLVPAIGLWVGWTLERAGHRPTDAGRAVWQPVAGLAAGWGLAALLGRLLHAGWTPNFVLWAVASLAAAATAIAAWPAAGRALLAYAAAARGLVVVVMAFAIARRWGTHYDAAPPGFPMMPRLPRFLLTGLLPQATIWIAFTVALGVAFAAAGWYAARRYDEARGT